MDQMRIESATGSHPDVRIVRLEGPFTLSTMFEFQTMVRESPAPVTIIDLAGVPYLDSAALGTLLGVHASCQREGRKYALTGISDRLLTLFKMTGVDSIVVRYNSAAEAETQLAGAPS
jgi:anti-anti-sigma factor